MTVTRQIHEAPVILIAGRGILYLTGAIILFALSICIEKIMG
jgi:hypothetical protein